MAKLFLIKIVYGVLLIALISVKVPVVLGFQVQQVVLTSQIGNGGQPFTSAVDHHGHGHGRDQHLSRLHAHPNPNRRNILQSITATSFLTTTASSLIKPTPAHAAQTAGEAVRRSAANIPGYGQPDIYFPPSFIGKWRATRTIVATVDDPFLSQMNLPVTIAYDVRFITVDGDTKSDGNEKVIMDRQFNEASYYNAIKNAVNQLADENGGTKYKAPSSVQTINWSPFNPNVCTSNYSDGSSKEIKVTKRAAELDAESGIISSSEYRRVTTVSGNGGMGIPSISASRVLTKWKSEGVGSGQVVEGIEIVYTDGGLTGDPMAAGLGGGGSSKPQLTSKSRLRLEKIED